MCFHTKQSIEAQKLEQRFQATFENIDEYQPTIYNGFTFPKTPIISNDKRDIITMSNWGLMPQWAKSDFDRTYTLNAKIETLSEKPSFKNSINNRCVVLVNGFYEWKWLDPKGKQKQKHLIQVLNEEPFALGGIYSDWTNRDTGEIVRTYTIVTTEAQDIMREIHNSKLRMPVALIDDKEILNWLNKGEIKLIANFVVEMQF